MSTGAECRFYEKEPRQWFYDLQEWPYGDCDQFETAGPFQTFRAAYEHLHTYNANPGGYSTFPLPDCPHDMIEQRPFDHKYPQECLRCGEILTVDNS